MVNLAPGRYANHFSIGRNEFEFVLECSQHYHESDVEPVARIITSPAYAKALEGMLRSAIAAYESQYGPIRPMEAPEV
jgi:hypothetical protein